jgi:hypothetical protein
MRFGFVVEEFALFAGPIPDFWMQAEGRGQQKALLSSAGHS